MTSTFPSHKPFLLYPPMVLSDQLFSQLTVLLTTAQDLGVALKISKKINSIHVQEVKKWE